MCDLMTAFERFPKYWLRLIRYYSALKMSLFIYVLPNFNGNQIWGSSYLHFSTGNLTENAYSGKFLNVRNEVNVTNVRN